MQRVRSRRAFVGQVVRLGAAAGGMWFVGGCGLVSGLDPQGRMRRVGFLNASLSSTGANNRLALVGALRETGWIEGDNLTMVWRHAELVEEQLPVLAAELVALPVDVLVAGGAAAVQRLMRATSSVPIVWIGFEDPLAAGWVTNLARPQGNVTGAMYGVGTDLDGKRMQLLAELVPGLRRVAYFWNSALAGTVGLSFVEDAASRLGIELLLVEARALPDIENAFLTAQAWSAQALLVSGFNPYASAQPLLAELAARTRLPAIYVAPGYVNVGGLMAYGSSSTPAYRRAGFMVDKLLRGARPADLPIERPNQLDFVVNRRVLNDLGLVLPASMAVQVTEWVD
jgi:putative tryptophan/tyrosine transport system substrate-binding protein